MYTIITRKSKWFIQMLVNFACKHAHAKNLQNHNKRYCVCVCTRVRVHVLWKNV